jgi:hypothetical protein
VHLNLSDFASGQESIRFLVSLTDSFEVDADGPMQLEGVRFNYLLVNERLA